MSARSPRLTRSAAPSAPSPARRITRSSTRNRRQDRTNVAAPPNEIAAGNKEQPIELLDDSSPEINEKPPAKSDEALTDFTCPICLDCPSSLTELATITGCTHRFCFECIDTWAKTENRCPCCKSRFRTINRVEHLPPSSNGRRDKRKRGGLGIGPPRSPTRRRVDTPVNSRQVEDRNQPSATTMNYAFIEQILNQFSGLASEHGGTVLTGLFAGAGPNGSTFRFSNVGGNPVMRIESHGGNGSYMEFYLAATEGEGGRPGRGRVRYNSGDAATARQFPAPPFAAAASVGGDNSSVNSSEQSSPFRYRTGAASTRRQSPRARALDSLAGVTGRAERRSPFRFGDYAASAQRQSPRSRPRRGDANSSNGGALDSLVGATDRAERSSPFRFRGVIGATGRAERPSPFQFRGGAASIGSQSPRSRSRRADANTSNGGAHVSFRFGDDYAASARRQSPRSRPRRGNTNSSNGGALDSLVSATDRAERSRPFRFRGGAANTNNSPAETLGSARNNTAAASVHVSMSDVRRRGARSTRSTQRNEDTALPLRRSARLRSTRNNGGSAEEPIDLA